jgi:hypothetical protein
MVRAVARGGEKSELCGDPIGLDFKELAQNGGLQVRGVFAGRQSNRTDLQERRQAAGDPAGGLLSVLVAIKEQDCLREVFSDKVELVIG